jgi:riboflavin synthase
MFTGIVEERGEVLARDGSRLAVGCRVVATDSPVGASIAINGTCLTVVGNDGASLAFDVSDETFARTTLGRLANGAPVNLERPVSLAARLGGHIVQGHVAGVGTIDSIEPDHEGGATIRVALPRELLGYVVHKGSIAIDGVSLTVAAIDGDTIAIAVIPHTRAVTTLGAVEPGDPVNVEVDVLAKYVERLIERAER